MPVIPNADPQGETTLQIRDVAAQSDYMELEDNPFGVISRVRKTVQTTLVTLLNSDNQDRCLTLVHTLHVFGKTWYEHPRLEKIISPNSEYVYTVSMPNVGSNGNRSLYPFAAVEGMECNSASGFTGLGVGIDLKTPGFFRTGLARYWNHITACFLRIFQVGLQNKESGSHLLLPVKSRIMKISVSSLKNLTMKQVGTMHTTS